MGTGNRWNSRGGVRAAYNGNVRVDIFKCLRKRLPGSEEWILSFVYPLCFCNVEDTLTTMRSLGLSLALLLSSVAASPLEERATTLIPKSVFDNTANLEQYFTYNYPWGGTTHNGTPSPLRTRAVTPPPQTYSSFKSSKQPTPPNLDHRRIPHGQSPRRHLLPGRPNHHRTARQRPTARHPRRQGNSDQLPRWRSGRKAEVHCAQGRRTGV